MLAIGRKLNERPHGQVLACEGGPIQNLDIRTRPFEPEAATLEVTDWDQQVVLGSILGILVDPGTKVLKKTKAAALEVWTNAANKLI